MDKFQIIGGSSLRGVINIGGAKNAALPAMFAALLADSPCRLQNIPRLADVASAARLITALGGRCAREKKSGDLIVRGAPKLKPVAPYDIVRTMRASILCLGPLLARLGSAVVSLPGGCAIGARPVDMHLDALKKMGAKIKLERGYIHARAKKLRGAVVNFDRPTVTGTENLMMAAAMAKGETILQNAAREPEVADLAALLNKMGAKVRGAGGAKIVISGADKLRGAEHAVMPDRMEAGTYAAMTAAAGGNVFLKGARGGDMRAILAALKKTGAQIEIEEGGVRVRAAARPRAVNIKTAPHPGFPTDMQAQLMAVNCAADGRAKITETIFDNRFIHAPELRRMGADIVVNGRCAVVRGARRLQGATVMCTDLRASASLVVAALAAQGKSDIRRIYHLDRGYEKMEKKLGALGANIKRIREK